MSRAPESPPDQIEDEVSDLELQARGDVVPRLPGLWDQQSVKHHRWLPESGVLHLIYQLVSYQMS